MKTETGEGARRQRHGCASQDGGGESSTQTTWRVIGGDRMIERSRGIVNAECGFVKAEGGDWRFAIGDWRTRAEKQSSQGIARPSWGDGGTRYSWAGKAMIAPSLSLTATMAEWVTPRPPMMVFLVRLASA